MARVAIYSARENTSLRPYVIFDGPESGFTDELRALGAQVIFRRSLLYDAFTVHAGENWMWRDVMAGAFLRFEVPELAGEDRYALYTDCDVLFMREPRLDAYAPATFAATSQTSLDPATDMNSGVMLINVESMRREMPALIDFTRRSLDLGLDQEILTAYFRDNYQPMARTLNWKTHWGINHEADIIHFHGPKPQAARNYFADGTLTDNQAWKPLLMQNLSSYQYYTRMWYLYHARMEHALRTIK